MQALWMVMAAFLFATMAVGIKIASGSFSLLELVFSAAWSAFCSWGR